MKRTVILAAVTTLLLCGTAFGQSNIDRLTANPKKEDGHFIGVIRSRNATGVGSHTQNESGYLSAEQKSTGIRSFELLFEFWALLGEPVYNFRFKWERAQSIGNFSYAHYADLFRAEPKYERMWERIAPLNIKIGLEIGLYNGDTRIATVYHNAVIDLPDPAGKWNTFSLPGSSDWMTAFPPTPIVAKSIGVYAYEKNNAELRRLHSAGDKEGYAEKILSLFRQADHIRVAFDGEWPINNLEWPTSIFGTFESAEKNRLAEASRASRQGRSSAAQSLDDLLNTTGYSQNEVAERKSEASTERADAAFDRITDWKDKAALNQARSLYSQATGNPETAAHARNQIARIDRLLNYKEPERKSAGEWVEIRGVKWATRNVGERGKFVAKPEDYGRLYTFQEAQTACPAGWRTPTRQEFESLDAAGSTWTTEGGVSGRKFGNGNNTIFLPAAGYRRTIGLVNGQGSNGYYWSSTASSDSYGSSLYFGSTDVYPSDYDNSAYGFSVRCIRP